MSEQMALDVFGFGEDEESEVIQEGENAPFSDEQVVESAFHHFRSKGFPYRKLPLHVCMEEINRLTGIPMDNLLRTNVAYHVADTYHPHRFSGSATGMRSPEEAFADDKLLRRTLHLYREHAGAIGHDVLGKLSIVSGTQACSNFRPGFACHIYRRFCKQGDTILDTSTGYGGRLVGFIASGVAGRYIGIDPSTKTHQGNTLMAGDLGYTENVELHNSPAEDVPLEALADRCDFAFTSPPYFRKEIYSDEDTQSCHRYHTPEAWNEGFLLPTMKLQYAALKAGCYSVLNIADVKINGKVVHLERMALKAAEQAGFRHVVTEDFGLAKRFGAGQKEEVAREPVLIFRKEQ